MTNWHFLHFSVMQTPHSGTVDQFEIVQEGEVRAIITPADHAAQLDIIEIINSGSHPAHWQTSPRVKVELLLPLFIGKERHFYITRKPDGRGGTVYTLRTPKGRLLKKRFQTVGEVYEEIQNRLAPDQRGGDKDGSAPDHIQTGI